MAGEKRYSSIDSGSISTTLKDNLVLCKSHKHAHIVWTGNLHLLGTYPDEITTAYKDFGELPQHINGNLCVHIFVWMDTSYRKC